MSRKSSQEDEQVAAGKTQTWKGNTQKAEAKTGIPGRNIEKLSEHAELGLGKPKPTWSQIWWGLTKATRRASINT